MRSYRIHTDRLVNQLLPHYLGGRKLVLYLQSLLSPLNSLNLRWKKWADDKRIEAAMTSQVIMLEYFLNRKYQGYLLNPLQRIFISEGKHMGVALFHQYTQSKDTLVLYQANETPADEQSMQPLSWENEGVKTYDVSFVVHCPFVNPQLISSNELTAMIAYDVNRYRIAGKKFDILLYN